jgi:hypothetical protein
VRLDQRSRNEIQTKIKKHAFKIFQKTLAEQVVEQSTDILNTIVVVLSRITSFSLFPQALLSEFEGNRVDVFVEERLRNTYLLFDDIRDSNKSSARA